MKMNNKKPSVQKNHENILIIKTKLEYLQKMVLGVFAAILINIIVNILLIK